MVSSTTITDGADDARRKPGWDGGATATGVVGLDHDGHLDAPAARPGRRAPHGLAARDARCGRAGRRGARCRECAGRARERAPRRGQPGVRAVRLPVRDDRRHAVHRHDLHGRSVHRRNGHHRGRRRPRFPAGPRTVAVHPRPRHRARHDRGRSGTPRPAAALRRHVGHDGLHHRRRREHRARPARQLHRLRGTGRGDGSPARWSCCSRSDRSISDRPRSVWSPSR